MTKPRRWRLSSAANYLDQFTFGERATDGRGNNNIAESIFEQMRGEPHSVPCWIVMSAGTGGTTATVGVASATVAMRCVAFVIR